MNASYMRPDSLEFQPVMQFSFELVFMEQTECKSGPPIDAICGSHFA